MNDHIQQRLKFLEELVGPTKAFLPKAHWEAICCEIDAISREVGEMHDKMADWQAMYQLLRDWADTDDPITTRRVRSDSHREAG
ncbi:MAG: hypothetical protein PF961_23565 [Planctomycetota bacterium]|jgi:hypothetical protein|nr:hypothetical protein [Planctomycetota bacterium]